MKKAKLNDGSKKAKKRKRAFVDLSELLGEDFASETKRSKKE